MGVPEMDVVEAMRFFGQLGYEGIEIRLSDQGTIDPADFGPDLAATINALRRETGVEVACLTPYFRQFHVPAERQAEMEGMRATVEMAARLACPVVRSFAGKNPPMEGRGHERAWDDYVSALQDLGREAAREGVSFAIESHGGTLAPSLGEAVRLTEAIGLKNVGVLMDYANAYEFGPHGREAVRLVAPYLKHVHIKDHRVAADGSFETVDFGAGNIAWPEVLEELAAVGYEGWVSDEYERCWHPELPPAEVAMRQHINWLRAWRARHTGA